MSSRPAILLFVLAAPLTAAPAQTDPLSFAFDRRVGQVEVGGRFAGAEFHGSRPLPSRISLYYPVANSIDLSTDYWKRGDSEPMIVEIRIDGGEPRRIGRQGWKYVLSPHRVTFQDTTGGLGLAIGYDFCFTQPALVVTLTITNLSDRAHRIEASTFLRLVLRTCQTYAWVDSAWTSFDSAHGSVIAHFGERETGPAEAFVENVGARPTRWATRVPADWAAPGAGVQWNTVLPEGAPGRAAAVFAYDTMLTPGDSFRVVQVIGSCRAGEADGLTRRLRSTWRSETAAYDHFVRTKASGEGTIRTGNAWIDRSADWARALLASNAHYIDGNIVPMPCPAEYNFFFTHDVLLTDLAASNFDTGRVRRDLMFIASHAKERIIPHAYYWRDDGFKTEYCTPDNWNHLWFVLAVGSYLRHSMDTSTCRLLYPLVSKSLTEILTQRKSDNLMYAFRPDWWDIGHIEGPRSFITILTIRALREYGFISAALQRESPELARFERMSDAMEQALTKRLWDGRLHYLINYNAGRKDSHFYMGSLLAPAFGFLSLQRAKELVATARTYLLAPGVGIRTVFPVDFNVDSVKAFYRIKDNEAGDPYVYANGGVWSHANAWYAAALRATGDADEGFAFFRQTMSIDGIAASRNGLPALYEYRYSNPDSSAYGKIDKPSFLWAGGFFLYDLYRFLGEDDRPWNITIGGFVPDSLASTRFLLIAGIAHDISQSRSGSYLEEFTAGGIRVPSRVVPVDRMNAGAWNIRLGAITGPYLDDVNAILLSASRAADNKALTLKIRSFQGHQCVAKIISPESVTRATLDGRRLRPTTSREVGPHVIVTTIAFEGSSGVQTLDVKF